MNEDADRLWQKKRGRQIMDLISDVLWETDPHLFVTYISPLDRQQRGYEREEVVGKHGFAFLADETQHAVMRTVTDYTRSLHGASSPLVLKDVQQTCKDGSVIWTDIVLNPVVENRVLGGFVGATRDATARKQAENLRQLYDEQIAHLNRELQRLSATDRLTGLSSREKLQELWDHEVARVKRYLTSLSIVLINLDSFRQINEVHGIAQGDAVLAEVGRITERFIRDNDSVVRWGNDEFLFVLPHTTADQARIQAERLRQTIEQYRFPVPERVTMSGGVTSYVDGDTLESIVTRADRALYIAKRAGHNQVEVR